MSNEEFMGLSKSEQTVAGLFFGYVSLDIVSKEEPQILKYSCERLPTQTTVASIEFMQDSKGRTHYIKVPPRQVCSPFAEYIKQGGDCGIIASTMFVGIALAAVVKNVVRRI